MKTKLNHRCRNCNSNKIYKLIDFKEVPLANNLQKIFTKKVKKFELQLVLCLNCWLVQTTKNIKREKIFNSEYPYLTSTSSTAKKNAFSLYEDIKKRFNLKNKMLLELASNDGYFLENFKNMKSLKIIGIEPTKLPANISSSKGIKTIKAFFGTGLAKKLKKKYKFSDLIVANNVIAHLSNIHDFVQGMKIMLNKKGTIIIEFQYFVDLVNKNLIDNIYHEHYYYYSLTSINNLLIKHGLKIYDAEKINTHGGSLRIFVCHLENERISKTNKFNKMIKKDEMIIKNLSFYRKFQNNYIVLNKNLKTFFKNNKKKKVIGFGAAAKASTFINIFRLSKYNIRYVIDNAQTKQGKFISGTNLKVEHPKNIKINDFDYVVIFAWNLRDEIINFIRKFYTSPKIKCVTFIPKLKITKI